MIVCTLGDVLLDVIVRLDAPPTAGDDAPARTRVGAGGQAANVAAWVTTLGAEARVIGKRADDPAGRLVAKELAARGVTVLGPVVASGTGVVVSLVAPGGERTMASDRGVAPELRPEEIESAWLADCDVLHLSGYALLRPPADRAALYAAQKVRADGGRISVDLSAWTLIRAFGPERFRDRLAQLEPDVVFANEAELETAGGAPAATTTVLKRGAAGCVVDGVEYAGGETQVVDTTGAGDALAAGFLVGGPELGLKAAARCVAQVGGMP